MSVVLLDSARMGTSIGRFRRRGRPTVILAVAVLALALAAAALAPLLAPHDPLGVDILSVNESVSPAHPLGTDSNGRDILSRVIFGLRATFVGPLLVVCLSTFVAVVLVLVAVWFRGWVDIAVTRLFDVLLAFPGLLVAVVASAVFGASLTVAALALSVSYVPYIGRIVRSQALGERSKPYIQAAWLQGMSGARISLGQLLPNLTSVLIAQIVLSMSFAIVDLAALSFLGLGVQPPTPDLGTMISTGQSSLLKGHPLETVSASVMIVVLVLALNTLGNAIRAWVDHE
jgi:peptide/nickel transport system permease protein